LAGAEPDTKGSLSKARLLLALSAVDTVDYGDGSGIIAVGLPANNTGWRRFDFYRFITSACKD
jgi:hypothetical protein